MQKKALCLLSGFIILFLMAITACAPDNTPTVTTQPTQTTTKPPTQTTTVPSDKPQYGGIINIVSGANYNTFGAAVSNQGTAELYLLEQLTTIDRTIGPAGSGKVDYIYGPTAMTDVVGCLAEKWSTPTTDSWVLDIRQGVFFATNPDSAAAKLVNGREMTADDVVFSFEYIRDTSTSWINAMEPTLIKAMTIEKTGPWQVTIHTPVSPNTAYLWLTGGGGNGFIYPKEMLQKYGTSNEWQDQVGTGPFILKDWVPNSVATYVRNDKYWGRNPVGPGKGDQLPYADGVKYYVIPDLSTQLSAFRTGKAEWITGNTAREDGDTLLKTNPDLKFVKVISDPICIGMRQDVPGKPYHDLRVRRALMMATDMQGILNGYYGGQGEILDVPARKLYPSIYTPLDQLPASTQELYNYNPEMAKQLLSDAGYPDGFKAGLIIQASSQIQDMAEIIKSQWAKVNIDVEIQPKETGVFFGIWVPGNFEDLIMTGPGLAGGNGSLFARYSFGYYRGPNAFNTSHVNNPIGTDARIEEAFRAQEKVINVDFPACDKLMKDLIPYILDQAFLVPTVAPYAYKMWQPWMKNYYGEGAAKYWISFAWIDQNLKSKMSGK